MDSARCTCLTVGKFRCPIHGPAPKDPSVPYVLNENDRTMLKSFRIATDDHDGPDGYANSRDRDIAQTRALDTFKWGLGTRERR